MYDSRYDEPSYDEAGEDDGSYDGANYDETSYYASDEPAYDEALDDGGEPGDDEDGPRDSHFQSRSTRLHHNNQEVPPKKKALVLGIVGSVVPHDQREKGATISAHSDARDVRQVLIGDFSPLRVHLQTFIFDHFWSDLYGYNEKDITMLIDDDSHGNIQPTEDNIVRFYFIFPFDRSGNEWLLWR